MNYWQIAAGDAGREYSDEFLKYGLAFVGGEFRETMNWVEVGDRIVLKRGVSEILAVGEVVERDGKHWGSGDKQWLRDFDGWDLQTYCCVDWRRLDAPEPAQGLTRGTLKRIHKDHIKTFAEKIIESMPPNVAPEPEPKQTTKVSDETILAFLITEGLRIGAAEDLTQALSRIRLLASYYYENLDWTHVREHETRTFLVVPLLLALGWAEQQIKIELPVSERRRADIACFRRPYAGDGDKCNLLIETKGFSQGLTYAPEQARTYAEHFPTCKVMLVSNGYCYKAYTRDDSDVFLSEPSAYLNLCDPRDRYPLDPDKVDGCLEVLRLLIPS